MYSYKLAILIIVSLAIISCVSMSKLASNTQKNVQSIYQDIHHIPIVTAEVVNPCAEAIELGVDCGE